MSKENLSGQALCQALMAEICSAIYGNAETQMGWLRRGTKTRVEEDMGRHVLALASLQLTEQQLSALEAAFCQIQEHLMGWLFSLVDGGIQPPGWPDKIRLVNLDTGDTICPEGLEWSFGLALAEYRAQTMGGTQQADAESV